jgi:hypothetical protein
MVAGYLRESIVFADLWPSGRQPDAAEHTELVFRMLASFLLGSAPINS